jgi:hypothetical protein
MPGTHAQNVTGVAEELQDLPPASTVALALALALALADVPPPPVAVLLLPDELLHAASSETAAAPATAMVILRVLVDIVVRLLCSVLLHLRAMPLSVRARGDDCQEAPRASLATAAV